jgi:predicted phosphoribosyltransferase
MFADRHDAGRRLAAALGHLAQEDPVVVGLPRGGVVVAAEVADALGAPLDVIVVRKLGAPGRPEFAIGALGEGGVRVLTPLAAEVSPDVLERIVAAEEAELDRRAAVYRAGRDPVPLTGRTVVIVDDGVATGATAGAACRVAKALGARRIVLAVPVAPRGWERTIGDAADEYVAVETPRAMWAVGRFYDDFGQTSDDEVVAALGTR